MSLINQVSNNVSMFEKFSCQDELANKVDSGVYLEAFKQATRIVGYNTHLNRAGVENLLVELDAHISKLLDEVYRCENFKELEASWLSLLLLATEATESSKEVQITVLDISKRNLAKDFEQSNNICESTLYREVYELEYNMPGGIPYSSIVADYYFSNSDADLSLLGSLAKVARLAHCPCLTSVNDSFFAVDSLDELYAIEDIPEHMSRPAFISWQRLRSSMDSRYLGLTMPSYTIRPPYVDYHPSSGVSYTETIMSKGECLWGNAAYLMAVNIIRSYSQHGALGQIIGPRAGGQVTTLPAPTIMCGETTSVQAPVELVISESLELKLSHAGIIPLSLYKNGNKACFFSACSAHNVLISDDQEASSNNRLNAKLPYIFLMSRIAHHLKVIHREAIGQNSTKHLLEQELNGWIAKLVTKMPDPDAALMAKRPLKEASVLISEKEGDPGNYEVGIKVVPHYQIDGIDIHLALVSQLPKSFD